MIYYCAWKPETMSSLDFPSGRRSLRPEAAAAMDQTSAPPTVSAKSRRRAAPWRPSLMAISEDVALFANGDAAAAKAAAGGGRRKASRTKAASGVGPRSFKDDYGYYGMANALPAFAPASFIF